MDATAVISGKGYLNLITISAQLKIVEDLLVELRFGLVLWVWLFVFGLLVVFF